jgi:FKBP-type peptidyl-prolyl cis-trans isomerase FkpA
MSVTAVPLRPIAKGSVVKLWIGLLLLTLIAVGVAWAGASPLRWTTTPSGLQYKVVKEGEGPHPTADDIAVIDYTGRLPDGTVFDTTQGKQPAPLPVRPGGVIAGFTEGLQLMRKGGVYKLRIPPKIGYGERGAPPAIPPNTTLDFDVKLVEIVPEATVRAMMQQQMLQQQLQQQMQGGGAGGGGAPPGALGGR